MIIGFSMIEHRMESKTSAKLVLNANQSWEIYLNFETNNINRTSFKELVKILYLFYGNQIM